MTEREHVLCARTVDADGTRALAARLAGCLADGDLVVLTGDLGAGKTCFTQGLARGLDIDGPITSPTFTLVSEHRGRLALHHLDVYRLDHPDEALDLDLPELLERGVTVIEWGERIAAVLPDDRLTVELRYPDLDLAVTDQLADDEPGDDEPGDGEPGDGEAGDGEAGDGEPGDDERRLRLALAGRSWLARREAVAAALGAGTVPC